ncbi:hypothetical protein ACI2KS_01425 [Pseudomonas sp. NPDC087358]|uniref:hypothetical protein n=1 Tax=Pseudomonas sp. NPDC087358 TaxID=3364439 RepID=UPI00384F5A7F
MNTSYSAAISINGEVVEIVPIEAHGEWTAPHLPLQRGGNLITTKVGTVDSQAWTINALLQLPAPTINGIIDGYLNPDEAPAQTPVTVISPDIETGDQVSLHWSAGGLLTVLGPETAIKGVPVVFQVPKAELRVGEAEVFYKVTAPNVSQASAVSEFTIDTWVDIVTDFATATTIAPWVRGNAYTQSRLVSGEGLRNETSIGWQHSGIIITTPATFRPTTSYRFEMRARNVNPASTIKPRLSIQIDGHNLSETDLTTSSWVTLQGIYIATDSVLKACTVHSHRDGGSGQGGGPDGGNDYSIRDIKISRV